MQILFLQSIRLPFLIRDRLGVNTLLVNENVGFRLTHWTKVALLDNSPPDLISHYYPRGSRCLLSMYRYM